MYKHGFLYLSAFMIVILTSCEVGHINITSSPSSEGDLNNQVGTSEPDTDFYELTFDFNEGLNEKTEYDESTGDWFITGGGNGEIGFGITAGNVLPGSEAHIDLHPYPENQQVRIQLTERHTDLSKKSLIVEKMIESGDFSYTLPHKENALYILSAEIINTNNEVEDTLISLIYVATQQMNAELYTNKQSYTNNESIQLTAINYGPTKVLTGQPYTIEVLDNDEWMTLSFDDIGFDDIGIIIEPNDVYEQVVNRRIVKQLDQGSYRIIKELDGEGTNISKKLAYEFKIK